MAPILVSPVEFAKVGRREGGSGNIVRQQRIPRSMHYTPRRLDTLLAGNLFFRLDLLRNLGLPNFCA
jgi:hypothetical protein